MIKRAYSYWMDSLNFFVGIHWVGDNWGDLDLLSERYQFYRRTIWIVRYAIAAPIQFASLLYFFTRSWLDEVWLILPFLAFNLFVIPPFMFWLLLKLGVIKRKPGS